MPSATGIETESTSSSWQWGSGPHLFERKMVRGNKSNHGKKDPAEAKPVELKKGILDELKAQEAEKKPQAEQPTATKMIMEASAFKFNVGEEDNASSSPSPTIALGAPTRTLTSFSFSFGSVSPTTASPPSFNFGSPPSSADSTPSASTESSSSAKKRAKKPRRVQGPDFDQSLDDPFNFKS